MHRAALRVVLYTQTQAEPIQEKKTQETKSKRMRENIENGKKQRKKKASEGTQDQAT